jgi:hypothetical protein
MEERRLKRDVEDFMLEMERTERREQVVRDARGAEVIDLTDDEAVDKRPLRTLSPNLAARQQKSSGSNYTEVRLVAELPRSHASSITSRNNNPLVKVPYKDSAPFAPTSLQPHRSYGLTMLGRPTRFTQRPLFQNIAAQFASHEYQEPLAFTDTSNHQVTHP